MSGEPYFFARNGLTLVRETQDPTLTRFYGRFLLSSAAKVLLYEDMKRQKLSKMVRGLVDGRGGRLGMPAGW